MIFYEINGVCRDICKKAKRYDLLEDMQQELALIYLQGNLCNTEKAAWNYVKENSLKGRVFLDVEIAETMIGKMPDVPSLGGYYCKRVQEIYEEYTRGPGITYSDAGRVLGISSRWLGYTIRQTLHLPVVSTKLKNKALEQKKYNIRKRNSYAAGCMTCEKGSAAKLTNKDAVDILLMSNILPDSKIEKIYPVGRRAIYDLLNGNTWKGVLNGV